MHRLVHLTFATYFRSLMTLKHSKYSRTHKWYPLAIRMAKDWSRSFWTKNGLLLPIGWQKSRPIHLGPKNGLLRQSDGKRSIQFFLGPKTVSSCHSDGTSLIQLFLDPKTVPFCQSDGTRQINFFLDPKIVSSCQPNGRKPVKFFLDELQSPDKTLSFRNGRRRTRRNP